METAEELTVYLEEVINKERKDKDKKFTCYLSNMKMLIDTYGMKNTKALIHAMRAEPNFFFEREYMLSSNVLNTKEFTSKAQIYIQCRDKSDKTHRKLMPKNKDVIRKV